jgi:hypothetical protein
MRAFVFLLSGPREFSAWLSAPRAEEEGAKKERRKAFLAAGVRYACQSSALLFGHERIAFNAQHANSLAHEHISCKTTLCG